MRKSHTYKHKYMRACLFVVCILSVSDAVALSTCVKLSPTSGTCSEVSVTAKYIDATVNCNGTQVTLVSQCSSSTGTADVSTANDIVINSSTPANNKYCWCRIVSPVTSKWVYRYAYSSNSGCAYSCSRGCANAFLYAMDNDVQFRTSMYNNLIY